MKIDSLGRRWNGSYPKRATCKRGHPRTEESHYADRHCKACKKLMDAERWLRSHPIPTDPEAYWDWRLRKEGLGHERGKPDWLTYMPDQERAQRAAA